MAVGDLRPGIVYFLYLEEDEGFGPFPYYKLGYTSYDTAQERIDEYKTGSPFAIKVYDQFKSEAAGLIEKNLHKKHVSRRRQIYNGTEWFKFESENDLKDAIKEARQWHDEWSEKVSMVSHLSEIESTDELIQPNEDTRALVEELKQKLYQQQAAKHVQKEQELIIQYEALTNQSKIRRLVGIKCSPISKGQLDYALVKTQHPELWDAIEKEKVLQESWAIDKSLNTTAREFDLSDKGMQRDTELKEKQDEIARALTAEDAPEIEPSDEVYSALREYDKRARQLEYLKAEIAVLHLELKIQCGIAKGIDGVCTWVREYKLNTQKLHSRLRSDYEKMFGEFPRRPVDTPKPITCRFKVNWPKTGTFGMQEAKQVSE